MPIGWEFDTKTGTWINRKLDKDSGSSDSKQASPTPTAGKGDSLKKAEATLKAQEYIIEGTATIAFPNPYLEAIKTVTFLNLGQNFSGEYKVCVVKNTISKSGYTQTLDVMRNATGLGFFGKKEPAETPTRTPKPVVEPVKKEEVYHTVVKGDTLWAIAKKYYGNGAEYPKIVAANPSIKDPHWIYPGQKFLIP